MKKIAIVVAVDDKNGIGKGNTIPWHDANDMKHFAKLTTTVKDPTKQNAVIMGYRTRQSIGRDLPNRVNIVLDRTSGQIITYESAVNLLLQRDDIETIFIIGGHSVYERALADLKCTELYMTRIAGDFDCDTFFPPFRSEEWIVVDGEQGLRRRRTEDEWKRHFTNRDEVQYLNLLRDVMETGTVKPDRTGVGTKEIIGAMMRFNLRDGQLPLFTTKLTRLGAIIKELLWMIRGQTDASILAKQGVHIWDGNTSREFLDKRGLAHYAVGDIGPAYGYQWRHYDAKYAGCKEQAQGGIDQLQRAIDILKLPDDKRREYDRRNIVTAWNPNQLHEMALPPCPILVQFVREPGDYVSILVYQRSADLILGVPFNVAGYALLLHMVAHLCGLRTKELIWMGGCVHIYSNHLLAAQEQSNRVPYAFPTVSFRRSRKEISSIDNFQLDDIELRHYYHHAPINVPMAV